MARTNITLHASGAETATGVEGALTTEFDAATRAVFYLNVTAASGTSPLLSVRIQEQDPVSSQWFMIDSFRAVTKPGRQRLEIDPVFATSVRERHIISGTSPSFTYTVSAVVSS